MKSQPTANEQHKSFLGIHYSILLQRPRPFLSLHIQLVAVRFLCCILHVLVHNYRSINLSLIAAQGNMQDSLRCGCRSRSNPLAIRYFPPVLCFTLRTLVAMDTQITLYSRDRRTAVLKTPKEYNTRCDF